MKKRFARVLVEPGLYTIETNIADEVKGQCPDDLEEFGVYREHNNHLVYIHEICSLDGSSIQGQIDYCKAHPRIAHQEVFPRVPIIDQRTEKVVAMLYHVDLIGILQGTKEYFQKNKRSQKPGKG